MKQYLQAFITYQQVDWVHWLPLAEFAANNSVSETTKYSLFFGNYDYNPQIIFSQYPVHNTRDIQEVNVEKVAKHMKELFDKLPSEIAQFQAIQAVQANKKPHNG
ncbi:hypothetical protein K440DRAFT_548266 [Wilcoxina mikolae CBS 423.85]|nr:hypothetical protein K440DRAFT_548266 [Wilcoxina mikolae CBS 423.85]